MKNRKSAKHNSELSFQPVVKYIIWFYLLVVIAIVCICSASTINSMRQEADFVSGAATNQIGFRVKQTVQLLKSLAGDEYFINPDISYTDKAKKLDQYSDQFGYMMICITDKDVNVWDETGTNANLGSREYMQKLYSTGETQITDSFAAGVDGVTLNYTVAAPIMDGDTVVGSIFAAIYFDEIEAALKANALDTYQRIALYGAGNQVMSSPSIEHYGTQYLALSENVKFLTSNAKQVQEDMYNGVPGRYWSLKNMQLEYSAFNPVQGTKWTVFCNVNFFAMLGQFLPIYLALIVVSTLLCLLMVVLAKKFIGSQMDTVDMLVYSVQELEKGIYQNEKPDNVDFKEIISLTSKGLTDSLTGVITRTVFANQIPSKLKALEDDKLAAICFVDLDNLKAINDTYGHSMGDIALKSVGYILREYEKKYDGLVSRHGGDEFVLLLTGIASREELVALLGEIVGRLHLDISANSDLVHVCCSLGAAICEKNDDGYELIISRADKALYYVKQNGKGTFKIYDEL